MLFKLAHFLSQFIFSSQKLAFWRQTIDFLQQDFLTRLDTFYGLQLIFFFFDPVARAVEDYDEELEEEGEEDVDVVQLKELEIKNLRIRKRLRLGSEP